MRKDLCTYTPLLVLLLLLLTGCHKARPELNRELTHADSVLFHAPDSAMVLLGRAYIDTSDHRQTHYVALLDLVARVNLDPDVKSASVDYDNLDEIYEYYKNRIFLDQDKGELLRFNYARACLYTAYLRHLRDASDSTIYPLVKSAQAYFKDMPSPDPYKARIYSFLAVLNNVAGNDVRSDNYFDMAFEEFRGMRDSLGYVNLMFDRIRGYSMINRYDKVKVILDEMEAKHLLINNDTRASYYSTYAMYHAAHRNYEQAIGYMRLQTRLLDSIKWANVNKLRCYSATSRYYSHLQQLDSAVKYAELAIDEALQDDMENKRLHEHYKNLGDVYSKARMYYEASYTYRKAFLHALSSGTLMNKKRNDMLEKKYNEYVQLSQAEKDRNHSRMVMIFLVALMLLMLLILTMLIYYVKVARFNRTNYELRQKALETELKQSKSMVDLISTSLGHFPRFIDRVNELSAKIFSTEPELYDSFQKEISQARSETRHRLLDIVNNEALIESSPELKYLYTLSNQEKMIMLLIKQGYSPKYISEVLNISQSSVRGSKVKIKAKIKALDESEEIKQSLLDILS